MVTQELAKLPSMGPAGQRTRRRHQFKSGAVYDGEWTGNERNGFGTQRWADGAEYTGQWSQNTATGAGRPSEESKRGRIWRGGSP